MVKNKNKNKKGLSGVVTAIVLVVIGLSAAALIGTVIVNYIGSETDQGSFDMKCSDFHAKIESNYYNQSGNNEAVVKASVGYDDTVPYKVKAHFYGADDESKESTWENPSAGSEKTLSVTFDEKPDRVALVSQFNESGEIKRCTNTVPEKSF